MKLRLVHQPGVPASASPYRLLDEQEQSLAWVNDFLDSLRLRQFSLRSLRSYGYDLLHFARWWLAAPARVLAELNASLLQDYVRSQLDQQPQPTAQTINHRLDVVRCLYRFHYGEELPTGGSHFQRRYTTHSPLGYGRRGQRVTNRLRLKQPRRVIVPLSAEEVAKFWSSFRTFRDLALLALMLFDGLRSCEVLHLQLTALLLPQAQLWVLGKGNKKRLLPLPAETRQALENYLRIERPLTNSPYLFVSLKGPQRGQPMTATGIRSLFRYHRLQSKVLQANPHRFRHTFGTDMVRAGISLPALMHLMGHSHIRTTMLYVELAPQDVWREFAQAIEKRTRLSTPPLL
jgi:site-specific recombinase XerD